LDWKKTGLTANGPGEIHHHHHHQLPTRTGRFINQMGMGIVLAYHTLRTVEHGGTVHAQSQGPLFVRKIDSRNAINNPLWFNHYYSGSQQIHSVFLYKNTFIRTIGSISWKTKNILGTFRGWDLGWTSKWQQFWLFWTSKIKHFLANHTHM